MKDLELRLTDLLARKADEVDVRPVDGFAETPSATALESTEPGSVTETRDLAMVELEPTAHRQPRSRVARGILVVATAAAVVGILGVAIARDDGAAASPLEEPSREEIALASNTAVYRPGNGPTEVTATRSYVSLRRCIRAVNGMPDEACDGPQPWAYMTGSADSPAVHYGLLGIADGLVLSALDDRYFVASAPRSLAQDPPSPPPAWLIDSATGQRGALTWREQPTALNSSEQVLVLFPAPDAIPVYTSPVTRFLPRVVDRRDWTISPLSVPEDASAALAIHQPGSGRIWIGTAPEGGHVGLAYTDDGGVSWTDVELPDSLRPTSDELTARGPGEDDLLVVAATDDHLAVAEAWEPSGLVVSTDAGKNWNTVPLDPEDGNGRRLFVLSDHRLMVVMSQDAEASVVRVSSSALDWSQLEESGGVFSELLSAFRTTVDVYQSGMVVHHNLGSIAPMSPPVEFSTDLNDWWTIPELQDSF
jgi:hypothetical protein